MTKAEKHQQQVLNAQFDAIQCTKYILQRLFELTQSYRNILMALLIANVMPRTCLVESGFGKGIPVSRRY